jgi:hypothetical protein
MAYIGNTVQNQGFTPAIDYFNGNGVTVTFTLSRPIASVAQVIVAVDNVIQNPSSSFTVAGNAITFSSAPLSGTNNIWVEYTSLITTYQAISQDPTVIGDIRATGGYLAEGDFGNSFVDGVILDYVTGLGRITVGSAEGIALYNGGTASRTALMTVAATGNVGIGTITPNSFSDPANNLVVGTTSGNNGITIVGGTTGISSIYLADGTTGNQAYRGYLEYGHTSDYLAFGTAASERMRIASGGQITMPSQPAVEVSRTASFSVSNNEAVGTVVPFNDETLDVGGNFDQGGTNRFTAPVAGKYEFHWSYGCNVGSNTVYRTYLWINGTRREDSQLRNDNSKTGSAYTWGSRTLILNLAANDYVELRASSDNGTDFYGDNNLRLSLGISLIS